MKKRFARHAARKILGLTLSLVMAAGTLTSATLAAETKLIEEAVSPVRLTCATENLELVDNDSSMEIHLCLTEENEGILQRIFREDVVLGGVFGDMFVSGVRNDRKTILLDLSGVPDLSGRSGDTPLQGTIEFPGALFGEDGSVRASVGVIGKEGTQKDLKPSFRPYCDGMRENDNAVDMRIMLLPILGGFSEDFSEDDISFARGLEGAKVRLFRADEDGCYEIMISVPKESMEEGEDGYSCFGSIILDKGSMVSPDGTAFDRAVYAVREYSPETVGRDLTEKDITTIKGIVGGFGNTTAGTVFGVISGGISAVSGGYTFLSMCGVFPNDSSRHAEIMNKLQEIQDTVNEISKTTTYMSGVLDQHTEMLRQLGVKIDEQFLGQYDADFAAMVEMMDTLEDEMNKPRVHAEIEAAIERVAEKYQVPQAGIGREFDEEYEEIVPDGEYFEYDYDFEEDDYEYAEEVMDFDTLIATGGLFEDSDSGTEIPDAFTDEEDLQATEDQAVEEETEEEAQAVEEAAEEEPQAVEEAAEEEPQAVEEAAEEELQAVEEAAEEALQAAEEVGEEETQSSETEAAQDEAQKEDEQPSMTPAYSTVPEAEQTAGRPGNGAGAGTYAAPGTFAGAGDEDAADMDEEIETDLSSEQEEEEESEALSEIQTEETEKVVEDRILDSEEMKQYLTDLDTEIGEIKLSSSFKIKDMLKEIALKYSTLSKYVNKLDSSNPINAFCSIHEGTDNFATTSQNEKNLYEEYLKCQLIRAVTILQALDSPTMYTKARTNLENVKWPDVTAGTRKNGNPYCYLMEGYVRLATVSEVQNWIEPMKNPKAAGYVDSVERTSKNKLHVSESEFFRRMHGRNLLEELELAGITNLDQVKNNDTWSNPDGSRKNFGGITFHYERWGVNNGYRKFKWFSTHARSDGVRYADPYTNSLGDYDGRNWGGEFLGDKNSYMIVAPEYIRWGYGFGDLPAESVLYQGNDKSTYYYYPMTYLVVL